MGFMRLYVTDKDNYHSSTYEEVAGRMAVQIELIPNQADRWLWRSPWWCTREKAKGKVAVVELMQPVSLWDQRLLRFPRY